MFLVRPTNRVFECFWVSFCILDGKIVFQCFWSDPKTLRVFECFSEVLYCFCHLGSGGIPFVVHESRKRRDEFFSDPAPPPPPAILAHFFFKSLDQKPQFSMGNFRFLAPENRKSQFYLRGGITSKLASQCQSWGMFKHAPTAIWRKRRLLY